MQRTFLEQTIMSSVAEIHKKLYSITDISLGVLEDFEYPSLNAHVVSIQKGFIAVSTDLSRFYCYTKHLGFESHVIKDPGSLMLYSAGELMCNRSTFCDSHIFAVYFYDTHVEKHSELAVVNLFSKEIVTVLSLENLDVSFKAASIIKCDGEDCLVVGFTVSEGTFVSLVQSIKYTEEKWFTYNIPSKMIIPMDYTFCDSVSIENKAYFVFWKAHTILLVVFHLDENWIWTKHSLPFHAGRGKICRVLSMGDFLLFVTENSDYVYLLHVGNKTGKIEPTWRQRIPVHPKPHDHFIRVFATSYDEIFTITETANQENDEELEVRCYRYF
jgi:hypothetical protein